MFMVLSHGRAVVRVHPVESSSGSFDERRTVLTKTTPDNLGSA